MKAVICAAGRGSRLSGLTREYPKALLPIGEKRVIEYILEALFACGIKDIVVALGYKEETVRGFLGRRSFGRNIAYVRNEHFEMTDNLYSMWLAREHITDGMLFVNGDTVFHADILKNFLALKLDNAVVVDPVHTEDHPVSVHILNKSIVEIGHDIEKPPHGSAFGIYKLSQSASEFYFSIAKEMFKDGPRKGGFFMPLSKMAGEIKIEPFFSDDPRWVNINTAADYERACRVFGRRQ